MSEPRNPTQIPAPAKSTKSRRKTSSVASPASVASPEPSIEARETAPASAERTQITVSDRHGMIALAAYYRAEKRRFAPGFEVEDWVAAEREVDQLLRRGALR
ncbi:MAG TPA: DUF2934 domain-containing protein [Steroidobacteraceae bacterium]|nr:DUF2934 domain-containing protein [Steroidobacteraceae bacterium]